MCIAYVLSEQKSLQTMRVLYVEHKISLFSIYTKLFLHIYYAVNEI